MVKVRTIVRELGDNSEDLQSEQYRCTDLKS